MALVSTRSGRDGRSRALFFGEMEGALEGLKAELEFGLPKGAELPLGVSFLKIATDRICTTQGDAFTPRT